MADICAKSVEDSIEIAGDIMSNIVETCGAKCEPIGEQTIELNKGGAKGDFEEDDASLYSDELRTFSEQLKTASNDSLALSEGSEKLSRITEITKDLKICTTRASAEGPVNQDLAQMVNKLWHSTIVGSEDPAEFVQNNSMDVILSRVVGSERVILQELTPVLNKVSKNEEMFEAALKAKNDENAKLKKTQIELRAEIESANKKISELLGKRDTGKNKELEVSRKENTRLMTINKQLTQKDKELKKTIAELELQLDEAKAREKTLMHKSQAHGNDKSEKLEENLNDCLEQLESVRQELETTRAQRQMEQALSNEKLNDAMLWETELRQREDMLARNDEIREMRRRLIALLEARAAL